MNKLWNRYNAWRVRSQQLSVARWAGERAKGKDKFALRFAFTFTMCMIAFHDIFNHFFDAGGDAFTFFYISQYAITGLCAGYGVWGRREGEYKKALKSSPPNFIYNRINPADGPRVSATKTISRESLKISRVNS